MIPAIAEAVKNTKAVATTKTRQALNQNWGLLDLLQL